MRTFAYLTIMLFVFNFKIGTCQSFHNLNSGFNYHVYSMFHDNDDSILYAGGWFWTQGNGDSINKIAQWDGFQWDSLGSGVNDGGNIRAITKFNGTLYVGGTFNQIGGVTSKGLAIWNGSNWNFFGNFTNSGYGYVTALLVDNTDLFIGGGFDSINGNPSNGLVKYDGVNFLNYPSIGSGFSVITAIARYNGELYVGGNFDPGGGKNDIVKFDGNSWVSVGGGLSGANTTVNDMIVYNGELYIAGNFWTLDGDPGDLIAKWNGISWSSVGSGLIGPNCFDLEVVSNELYVGGSLISAGGMPISQMAKWNGSNWISTVANLDGGVICFEATNDNLFIGGGFLTINGDTMNHISKYDISTGLFETDVNDIFNVYPNPATSFININLNLFNEKCDPFEFVLFDLLGKEVAKKTFEMNSVIDISPLVEGIYTYRISNSTSKIGFGKIVKQN